MSINILDSFNYKGRRPDFVRQQFGTIEAMRTFSENYLPDMYLCYCLEDGKVYLYNKDNTVDQTTGRWRQLESGGGGGDMTNYYTKTETNTLLNGKQDVLEYDSVPTFGSTKVMTSDAIATALTGKMNVEIRDNTPTAGSTRIVASGGVYTEFQRVGEEQRKQDTTLNFLANNTVKNIINTSVTSFTHRGITYTVGNDGKISIDGTLDSSYDSSYCWVIGGVQGYNNDTPYSQQVPIPKGAYALTMSGGSASTYYAILGYRNTENGNRIVKYIYDGEVTFEIMYDTGRYDLAIYCVTTQENYSATADLMLRPVSIADSSYRPYAPTNKELYDLVRGKQDALTVDSTPTSGSSNPVTSGGIKTYVDASVADKIEVSDVYGLGSNTTIPSDADIDTYIDPGVYIRNSSSNTNITNKPIESYAFKLVVEYVNNDTRIIQRFYPNWNMNAYFVRQRYRNATEQDPKEWSDWSKIGAPGTIGMWAGGSQAEPKDIKTLGFGLWYRDSNASTYLTGLPDDYNFGTAIIEVQSTILSTRRRITLYPSTDATAFWICTETADGWTNWVKFEGAEKVNSILTPISESAYEALATKDKPLYFIYD